MKYVKIARWADFDHHFEQRGAQLPLGANEQRGAKSTRNPRFIKLLLDLIRIPDRMQSIFVGNSVFVRTLRPRNRHSTNVLHNTMLMQYITFHLHTVNGLAAWRLLGGVVWDLLVAQSFGFATLLDLRQGARSFRDVAQFALGENTISGLDGENFASVLRKVGDKWCQATQSERGSPGSLCLKVLLRAS